MKIIISPAKKMNTDTDSFEAAGMPEFLADAKILMKEIQKMTPAQAKALWKCSDRLAELNYRRFQQMNLEQAQTAAVMSYEGLQYQHMKPGVFSKGAVSYIEEHLRILSGFYGLLRPFDKVTPYRLEMQAKLAVHGHKDLYDFWGDRLYKSLLDGDRTVINLASKEYSQCIEKYITPDDRFVTLEFSVLTDGKLRQKGTPAKMARGEMVRFLAEHAVSDLQEVREFHELGFSYREELSDRDRYVFVCKGTVAK